MRIVIGKKFQHLALKMKRNFFFQCMLWENPHMNILKQWPKSCEDGYSVKSSLKAEDGIMYPLEKSSFFLPKPPTLILHEEIDYGEFERHAGGGSNMHYFDLLIRLKSEQ